MRRTANNPHMQPDVLGFFFQNPVLIVLNGTRKHLFIGTKKKVKGDLLSKNDNNNKKNFEPPQMMFHLVKI